MTPLKTKDFSRIGAPDRKACHPSGHPGSRALTKADGRIDPRPYSSIQATVTRGGPSRRAHPALDLGKGEGPSCPQRAECPAETTRGGGLQVVVDVVSGGAVPRA